MRLTIIFGALLFLTSTMHSQVPAGNQQAPKAAVAPDSNREDVLRSFLRGHLNDHATMYFAGFVDLDGNGSQDVIVYFTDRCGSGGCTTWVLALEGSSYRVVTRITITRLPIRVLETRTNGWHDISVVVGGGGIIPAYEAKLRFDGKTYPSNPSVPPAEQLTENVRGKVIVPVGAEGRHLY